MVSETTKHPSQSFLHKGTHLMWVIISVLIVFILFAVGVLQLWSFPGQPEPFADENGNPLVGSLSEKVFVDINGVKQGMVIMSRDANNPVLLYLHGGMPDYFLTQQYPTPLEEHFTVVWWEQRGAGLSYSADVPAETMTVEQLVADTLEMTNYLRNRFGQQKIYLMGHSGGSFLGIQAVSRSPELYHAYIGVAQMANQLESETLAYDYMLDQFKMDGNTKMVQKMEAAPVTLAGGIPDSYYSIRDVAMHSLGVGTTHDMNSVVTGLLIPSFQFREYTLGEKINLWRGKARTGVSSMWKEMVVIDLNQQVTALDLPVYFLHGVYDYTCAYQVAKDYFENIQAPVKGFYTFEASAHSPMFEEPEKMERILLEDVLVGANDLADAQ